MSQGKPPRALQILIAILFTLGFLLGITGFYDKFSSEPKAECLRAQSKAPDAATATPTAGADGGSPSGAGKRCDRFDPVAAWDAFHATLQLVVLNVDQATTKGPLLGTARILLPLATSTLVLLALWEKAVTWLWLFYLRVRQHVLPLPDMVAVIGCGHSGLTLAQYYKAGKLGVIGLDRDPDGPAARRFSGERLPVIEFDFTARDRFKQFPWHTVARVVISTGDDLTDTALARGLIDQTGRRAPRITVSADGARPQRVAEFDAVLNSRVGRAVSFIDLRQHSARLLYRRFAPHVLCGDRKRFVVNAPAAERPELHANRCHIVLSMQGQDVESYLLEAVRALVYSPDTRLRVTVLTEEAEALEQRLRAAYPALWPVSTSVSPKDDLYGGQAPLADIAVIESATMQINARAMVDAHAAQAVDAIYVKGRSDAETLVLVAEATKVAAVLDARPSVVAGFTDRQSGAAAKHVRLDFGDGVDKAATGVGVHAFWLHEWLAGDGRPTSAADSPEAFNDDDAAWYHAYYEYCQRGTIDFKDPAARAAAWNTTNEARRWFNRRAADHVGIKLALIENALGPNGGEAGLAAAVATYQETLADLEHRRYVCERMSEGWLNRPPRDGNDAPAAIRLFHLNPTLRPFAGLHPDEVQKDRDMLLGLLEHARDRRAEAAL